MWACAAFLWLMDFKLNNFGFSDCLRDKTENFHQFSDILQKKNDATLFTNGPIRDLRVWVKSGNTGRCTVMCSCSFVHGITDSLKSMKEFVALLERGCCVNMSVCTRERRRNARHVNRRQVVWDLETEASSWAKNKCVTESGGVLRCLHLLLIIR